MFYYVMNANVKVVDLHHKSPDSWIRAITCNPAVKVTKSNKLLFTAISTTLELNYKTLYKYKSVNLKTFIFI